MVRSLQERFFEYRSLRWIVGLALLGRGSVRLMLGKLYRGLDDICRVRRVSAQKTLDRTADRIISGVIREIRRTGVNPIVQSYRNDSTCRRCASLYSIAGPGSHDLFRDLIVLRRATPDQKGVILLKYAKTFDAVVALFDLDRLMERYTFVLEPCWAGYCHPSLLMFLAPEHPVIVQCFTEEDYEWVRQVGFPLQPIRLGPADWVNADLFSPGPSDTPKEYDLVMVANWARHKRHSQLFRALRKVVGRPIRVLLIGFPWGGRTAEDIRREAATVQHESVQVDVLERLSAHEVAHHVSRSKVFVFLSRKEGDNKALVEAMFANVPAIVYDKTVGGASRRINRHTGIFASDEELPDKIRFMLDHWKEFHPRAWALEHSGSANATRILDDALRRGVTGAGGASTEAIVEKTNSPNLAYKDPAARSRFEVDYQFILQCRRAPYAIKRDAVA